MTRNVVAAAIAAAAVAASVGVRAYQAAPANRPPSRADAIAAARTVMADARYATLITLDDTGHPQARIVDPFPPDEDLAIWIATNARSRKVGQIAADPRVNEKAKRWKEEWAMFYKDRNRGDDYLLISVTPRRLEVVSERLGMTNDPVTWRPVVVDLTTGAK